MKHNTNGNPQVIYWSLLRTDAPYMSTSWFLAEALSEKGCSVFYVNHPQTWKDFWLKPHQFETKPQFQKNTYQKINDQLWIIETPPAIPVNWLPPGKVYMNFRWLNHLLALRVIHQIKKEFKLENYFFINCYDPFFWVNLKDDPACLKTFYQSVDDIGQEAYTAKHGVYLEEIACREADQILVTSSELKSKKSVWGKDKVFLLSNAANVQHFEKAFFNKPERPKELEPISKPIIGYIGNLDRLRIDFELLIKLAHKYPEYHILIVGPYDEQEVVSKGLSRFENISLIGRTTFEHLPDFLHYFDVCIIPFLCNDLTKSIYPLKVNEYLAGGKPVVSTAFSEDIKNMREFVHVCDNHNDFLQAIARAMILNDEELKEKRRKFASSNSWAKRAEVLLNSLFLPKN